MPLMHKGHFKLQIFMGSIVRMGGNPHTIGFFNIIDKISDREDLIIFNIRLSDKHLNNLFNNSSFKNYLYLYIINNVHV